MLVQTARFGELDVDEQAVIHFPEGILGFEEVREFFFVDQGDGPFRFLQAVRDENLTFVVVSPTLVRPDYTAPVTARDLEGLELSDPAEALVYAIVTVPQDVTQMTANLRAPLIINPRARKGRQVVLADERWPIRYKVFAEVQAKVS